MNRNRNFSFSTILLVLCIFSSQDSIAEDSKEALEERLFSAVEYLSSDELEGRGLGTKGLEKAADYIVGEFAKIGLNTESYDGEAFQHFKVTTSAVMGPAEKNHLTFVGPAVEDGSPVQRIEIELEKGFNPLSIGGSAKFDLPLVFAGYGITSQDPSYDDYDGIDVKGKAVVILRKEPQQGNPHSLFNGTENTSHAFFSRKVSNAYEHGAAAVIFVNDQYDLEQQNLATQKEWRKAIDDLTTAEGKFRKIENPTPEQWKEQVTLVGKLAQKIKTQGEAIGTHVDKVLGFQDAGTDGGRDSFPVIFCSRVAVNRMFKAAGMKDLTGLEHEIDKDLKPRSRPISNWKVAGETNIDRKQADVKNVIAVLEGHGPSADETIVVGAHYDHLGYGGVGSFVRGRKEIHNGADDNASGTAVLIEVARRLASRAEKLPRRVVFIAFTGEERGLLGSAHYVNDPKFPLEKTIAMINMDMVGRMVDDKLIVHGTGTAVGFDTLINELNRTHGFKITKKPSGFGPSDHSSFYSQQIPVMHFFTGTHNDYHRPGDDVEKINVPAMRRVSDLITDLVDYIATNPERPKYQETERPQLARGGSRPYFGSIPDFGNEVEGYALMGVAKNSPAAKGGIQKGDVIVKLGESKIGGLEDFDSALRKYKAGDEVKVIVIRGEKKVPLSVTLAPPR